MANITIIKDNIVEGYREHLSYEVDGKGKLVQEMCEKFLEKCTSEPQMISKEDIVKIGDLTQEQQEVKEEVVAIYDNAGIPSFMYRFTKKENSELFPGGQGKVHPAFIIDGKEYDEIYISVYQNCEINGKPYSLPYMVPWTNITNDRAAEVCFSKGEGWHLMTRAEWGLIANICARDNRFPHGNANYGKSYKNEKEYGKKVEYSGKTLTGSGPASWTHNHQPDGIHDLCGNVWEMVRGLRVKDGMLQVSKNNDAAMDIDLSEEGTCWCNVVDDEGKPIYVSVKDGELSFVTKKSRETGYAGDEWGKVSVKCKSELLLELGLYCAEENAYLYLDSTTGERLPLCGGRWYVGSHAGVFCVNLSGPRTNSHDYLGFRSAFYKKRVSKKLDTE